MKQSEMRFDGPPGYYTDYRGRRGSHQVPKGGRKIDLPTKEPVELRKAEHRWVRPQVAVVEDNGDEQEKETQVCIKHITLGVLRIQQPQQVGGIV